MKILLLLIFSLLFLISSVISSENVELNVNEKFLKELDFRILLEGKSFTCIRPYYRRNYPLVRLGAIREMDGLPVGPFSVQFEVIGTGSVYDASLQNAEEHVITTHIKGSIRAVQTSEGTLTKKQKEDLFLEIDNPWVYEMPVDKYYPVDSGVLMNLKHEANLSPEEEGAKMRRMEVITAKLEVMIAEQNLDGKKAIEMVDKRWHDAPSGLGDRVKNGHRKIVLIVSQQKKEKSVEEVLFVVESPVNYYEETVAWCATDSVIKKAVKIGREIRELRARH